MRDLDIRRALHRDLARQHDGETGTLFLDEFGLCQGDVRVDVAVLNGSIAGYEIKSERDTLDRLPRQQAAYSRVLDEATLIASEKHLEAAKELVPLWWGLVAASEDGGDVRLHTLRAAARNPSLDPLALAQLLWRDEALDLLSELGLDSGIRGKPRAVLWRRLAASVSLELLRDLVRERVKARGNWRSAVQRT